MGGWRSKLLFLLIVYFAGFATAIYCLAPGGDEVGQGERQQCGFGYSALKSDEFAGSFNVRMRQFMDIAKQATGKAGELLKEKLDERQVAQNYTK